MLLKFHLYYKLDTFVLFVSEIKYIHSTLNAITVQNKFTKFSFTKFLLQNFLKAVDFTGSIVGNSFSIRFSLFD